MMPESPPLFRKLIGTSGLFVLALAMLLGLASEAKAATSSVDFRDPVPANYVKGSGQRILFEVSADPGKNARVIVQAWSHEERRIVQEAIHIVNGEPWEVDPSMMDKLPDGRVNLQLLLQENGQLVDRDTAWMEIEPAVVTGPEASTVAFANPPASFSLDAVPTIGIWLNGSLPTDGDVLVIAWSDSERRMVDEFAHTLTSAPFEITPAKLSMLPAGRTNLQLMLRQKGRKLAMTTHWVDVKPAAAASIAFADTAPSTYQQGSGTNIGFAINGNLPSGSDVEVSAVLRSTGQVVSGFTHTLTSSARQIAAARLDTLPAGEVDLRLALNMPGYPTQTATHTMNVVAPKPVMPTVTFASGTPDSYRLGSGGTISLNVDGEMPKDGSILFTAWSDATQGTVDTFAFSLTASPWQIPAAKLELLPVGRTNLRATVRVPGLADKTVDHWIEIQPRLATIAFADSGSATYQQGSGTAIAFKVNGFLPDGSEVEVSARSVATQQAITGFTHTIASEPWQISAAKLDTLPAGDVDLKLTLKMPGESAREAVKRIDVVPVPPTAMPTVQFLSSAPTTYQRGSGATIAFNVDGALPTGADVLAIAWSEGERRMVDEFAHAFTASPWRLKNAKLDVLPTGRVNLQLLLRVPGQDAVQVDHWIDVTEPPTEVPVTPVDVAFASGAMTSYQVGSGQSLSYEVTGDVPEGADLLVIAWSNAESRMVDEFAHVKAPQSGQISSAKLDTLPAGGAVVQLHVRIPGQEAVKDYHTVNVYVSNPGDGGDGGTTDPGDGGTTDPGDGGTTDPDDGGTTDPGDGGTTDPGDGGYDPGDTVPTEGWTQFSRSSDTRVIYVSSSSGSDSNDGLSPEKPLRSFLEGFKRLRSGYPDWLLLKRGDRFELSDWLRMEKSGRSTNEKLIIGGYGSGSRPVVYYNDSRGTIFYKGKYIQHLAIVGVEFDAHDVMAGIMIRGSAHDILLEDCKFSRAKDNIEIQTLSSSDSLTNIAIRRCVIVDSYSTGSGHSQGLYASHVDGLLIEENIFDHNGWNPEAGADPTIFNHNIYLFECKDVVVRGNILSQASSFGLKISSDYTDKFYNLLVEDNVFVGNGNGLTIGNSTRYDDFATSKVTIRNNIFTEIGRTISGVRQCFGVSINSVRDALIERNCFIYKPYQSGHPAMELDKRHAHRDVVVKNNVLYQWNDDGFDVWITTETPYGVNIVDTGNLLEWPAERFMDPSRMVETYNASLGGSATLDAYLREARKQRKENWREAYMGKSAVSWIRSGFSLKPLYD